MANKVNYFKLMSEQVEYCQKAARKLHDVLTFYNPDNIEKDSADLHIIEHQADIKNHDIQNALSKEFITPIDREDIVDLVQEIDTITDCIDDILIRAYMYNIQKVTPEAVKFSELIVSSSDALISLMGEFENFRKSKTIKDDIIKLNLYEENGDAIYQEAVSKIFRNEDISSKDLYAWMNLYEALEAACDSFETVSNLVELVIMKNL